MIRNIIIILTSCIVIGLNACTKENFSSSQNDKLKFSTDTVFFDTIFSETGSITKYIKIYNPNKGILSIDDIYLGQSATSEFYINVNGINSNHISHIEIAPGDSIFIFVQAKLKENSRDTALFHEDDLIFEYNSNKDKIPIIAWGQDVVNYKGSNINTTTFTANKPYVIYDSLVVNQGETLTIEAGTKIYMHYNSNIIIHGTLKILGALNNPVLFTSDRLEESYQMLPGQWGSIIFSSSSIGNEIHFATIKNGINGLILNGTATKMVDIIISNSKIENMNATAIYARNAHIESFNSVYANCNNYVLALQGGWHSFVHNTIFNNGALGGRKGYPSVIITDYFLSDTTSISLQQANFYNSIIVGQIKNEIEIFTKEDGTKLSCVIEYCLLKDTYVAADSIYYGKNQYYNESKSLFVNKAIFSFELDTLSQAQNIGSLPYGNLYPNDILDNSRIIDLKPDVGAYEYFYKEE